MCEEMRNFTLRPTGHDACLHTCVLKPSENLIFLETYPHNHDSASEGRPHYLTGLLPASPRPFPPAALGHTNTSWPPATPGGVFVFFFLRHGLSFYSLLPYFIYQLNYQLILLTYSCCTILCGLQVPPDRMR